MLEEFGLIEKQKMPSNKKVNIYTLTSRGVALVPVLIELTLWSKHNIHDFNPGLNLDEKLEWIENNKEAAFNKIINDYQIHKQSILEGKRNA